MAISPGLLVASVSIAIGVSLGPWALVALARRTPLSRVLGLISIACIALPTLAITAVEGWPPQEAWVWIGLSIAPGIIAIVFNRTPRSKPGHCTKCGYNLTGNTSGVCSECGAAVRCKTCGYNLTGNISGKCSECGAPVVAP